MKLNHFPLRPFLARPGVLLVLLLAPGCAMVKPAHNDIHYYTLTTGGPALSSTGNTLTNPTRYVVRIRPVELAAYLRTKQIAVRAGTNEVQFSLHHQWAESLDDGARRVLAENLRRSAAVQDVVTDAPTRTATTNYTVSIQILACEGIRKGAQSSAELKALWQITRRDNVLEKGEFRMKPVSWDGQNFGELAQRLSEGMEELATVLLGALTRCEPTPS